MFRFILVFFFIVHFSFAHSVQYKVSHKNAVVIKIFFPDGTPFSYEKFEIYSPDNTKIPYQVGRTDKYGRIIFIPDKVGNWTIKAFSEDGHGIIDKIYISKLNNMNDYSDSSLDYFFKIVAGILIIFLIYGTLYITIRRKKS